MVDVNDPLDGSGLLSPEWLSGMLQWRAKNLQPDFHGDPGMQLTRMI